MLRPKTKKLILFVLFCLHNFMGAQILNPVQDKFKTELKKAAERAQNTATTSSQKVLKSPMKTIVIPTAVEVSAKNKFVVYQVFTRLFGNKNKIGRASCRERVLLMV